MNSLSTLCLSTFCFNWSGTRLVENPGVLVLTQLNFTLHSTLNSRVFGIMLTCSPLESRKTVEQPYLRRKVWWTRNRAWKKFFNFSRCSDFFLLTANWVKCFMYARWIVWRRERENYNRLRNQIGCCRQQRQKCKIFCSFSLTRLLNFLHHTIQLFHLMLEFLWNKTVSVDVSKIIWRAFKVKKLYPQWIEMWKTYEVSWCRYQQMNFLLNWLLSFNVSFTW